MKMNARKKKTTILLSIALVIVIAIGGTLAYLSSVTGEAENAFSFSENVRARLDEPNWNPEEGEDLIPGYQVKKDPMITNVSNNGVEEYAAIRIVFTDGDGRKLTDAETVKLLNMLDITWNPNWTLRQGTLTMDAGTKKVTAATAEQIYVYNSELAPGEVSDPVFSSVTIKSDITDEDYTWLASIVMDHTDECYTFGGAHNPDKCTLTYKHHASCAVYGETDAATTPGQGTTSGKTCNCIPAEVHIPSDIKDPCPAVKGTLITDCGHTAPEDAIKGFKIIVQGAVVQAGVEGMTSASAQDTIDNLIALFTANPYTP